MSLIVGAALDMVMKAQGVMLVTVSKIGLFCDTTTFPESGEILYLALVLIVESLDSLRGRQVTSSPHVVMRERSQSSKTVLHIRLHIIAFPQAGKNDVACVPRQARGHVQSDDFRPRMMEMGMETKTMAAE